MESYYRTRRDLDGLLQRDIERRALVALAVVQSLRLSSTKVVATRKNDLYELVVSRLKQEKATSEKLYESRIDLLKEEVAKLKKKTRDQEKEMSRRGGSDGFFGGAGLSNSGGSLSSSSINLGRTDVNNSFSTSPYVSKLLGTKGYLSPTMNLNLIGRQMASPRAVLSPLLAKLRPILAPTKAKRTYTNYNSILKGISEGMSGEEILNTQAHKKTPKKNNKKKNNPEESFGASTTGGLFDGSMKSSSTPKSSTPKSSTPKSNNPESINSNNVSSKLQKTPNNSFDAGVLVSGGGSRKRGRETPETMLFATDGDDDEEDSSEAAFASANSTFELNGRKKRRKVQLRAVSAPKTDSPSKGFNLEDEETNTANYYQDLNFTEEAEPVGPKSAVMDLKKAKKRKNVFKID